MLNQLSKQSYLFYVCLLVLSSLSGDNSVNRAGMEPQDLNVPFDIGADDTRGPDEVYKLDNTYDPTPFDYDTNRGYDEYVPESRASIREDYAPL